MPAQGPPPQEYVRIVLVIILLFFLYTSPDQGGGPGFNARDYLAERIARSRHNLNVLNTTSYGDFAPAGSGDAETRYLNLTGFRENDGYAWERLEAWKKRSEVFYGEAKGRWKSGKPEETKGLAGEVYENVTGIVHGRWVRYNGDLAGVEMHRSVNLSTISPGIDWAYRNEESWTRNITGKEGKLMLRIDEKHSVHTDPPDEEATPSGDNLWSGGLVRNVAATMTVQDESSSGDGWEMRIHGVHWPRQGVLLMTTTSEKFAGVFGLPHLTMRKEYFATSQKLLNRTLEQTIEEMENSVLIDPSNPWTSSPEAQADATMPTPHCEYVVYVQLYPVDLELEFNRNPADSAKMIHQI